MTKIMKRLDASYEKPVKIKSFNQLIARRHDLKSHVNDPEETTKIKDIAEEKRMFIPSDVGKFSDL